MCLHQQQLLSPHYEGHAWEQRHATWIINVGILAWSGIFKVVLCCIIAKGLPLIFSLLHSFRYKPMEPALEKESKCLVIVPFVEQNSTSLPINPDIMSVHMCALYSPCFYFLHQMAIFQVRLITEYHGTNINIKVGLCYSYGMYLCTSVHSIHPYGHPSIWPYPSIQTHIPRCTCILYILVHTQFFPPDLCNLTLINESMFAAINPFQI